MYSVSSCERFCIFFCKTKNKLIKYNLLIKRVHLRLFFSSDTHVLKLDDMLFLCGLRYSNLWKLTVMFFNSACMFCSEMQSTYENK